MKIIKQSLFPPFLIILIFCMTGCATTSSFTAFGQYTNPSWAPPYSDGVKYYYLPDIETYYDLSNNDFIYLDNGQWQFSATLPPMYSNYDLFNGFEVSLNNTVYQPWMHHQYYSSHYPRYYYRNKYAGTSTDQVRGFNENQHKPMYREHQTDNHISASDNTPVNTGVVRKPIPTRPPQMSIYKGKSIGAPVKVRHEMRQPRQENKVSTTHPR